MTSGQTQLEHVRSGAPTRSPTVRVLASYASHTDCNLASLGFAARVDFDRLLIGTKFQAPFGRSPFAFSRGTNFERLLRENNYATALRLLQEKMEFAATDARTISTINLRQRHANNR